MAQPKKRKKPETLKQRAARRQAEREQQDALRRELAKGLPPRLRIAEVAALFDVRRETIWAWERKEVIPRGDRIGGIVTFDTAAIQQKLTELRRKADEAAAKRKASAEPAA